MQMQSIEFGFNQNQIRITAINDINLGRQRCLSK